LAFHHRALAFLITENENVEEVLPDPATHCIRGKTTAKPASSTKEIKLFLIISLSGLDYFGRSRAGFLLKNPCGAILKLIRSADMTG